MQDDSNSNEILDKDNLRKTKSRTRIIELLQKSDEPKSAEEIYLILKSGGEKTSLSTVYRTCETLTKKGIFLKSGIIDDGKDRYEFNHLEHRHHAICMICHKIIPIDECPFGHFDVLLKNRFDFEVTDHKIEIYGYCHECQKKHLMQKQKKDE